MNRKITAFAAIVTLSLLLTQYTSAQTVHDSARHPIKRQNIPSESFGNMVRQMKNSIFGNDSANRGRIDHHADRRIRELHHAGAIPQVNRIPAAGESRARSNPIHSENLTLNDNSSDVRQTRYQEPVDYYDPDHYQDQHLPGRRLRAGSNFENTKPTQRNSLPPGDPGQTMPGQQFDGMDDAYRDHYRSQVQRPSQSSDNRSFPHFSGRLKASEQVIRLQGHLRQLQQAYNSLKIQNATLNEKLRRGQQMLITIQQSMDEATVQLDNAKEINKSLREQVSRLEFDLRTQKQESAQLLGNIQRQLNELLTQEITNDR